MAIAEAVGALQQNLPYGEVIYTEEEVQHVVGTVAMQALERYKDADPIFIGNFDGAALFYADFLREIARKDEFFHPYGKTMVVSRFGKEEDGGKPGIQQELRNGVNIEDRNLVGLEEMVDRGDTVRYWAEQLLGRGAASFELVTLGIKPTADLKDVAHPINGLWLPPVWCTGYGMDHSKVTWNGEGEGNRFMSKIAVAKGKKHEMTDEQRQQLAIERVKIGLSPYVGGPIIGRTTRIQPVLS